MEIYWDKDDIAENASGNKEESFSSTDSEDYADQDVKALRRKQKEVICPIQEYENLKIEFLQFKKEKMGTTEMHEQSKMREEKKLLSNLELQRLKYVQKQRVKLKEGEVPNLQKVLKRLQQFRNKINSNEV